MCARTLFPCQRSKLQQPTQTEGWLRPAHCLERWLLLYDDNDMDELVNYEGEDAGRPEDGRDKGCLDRLEPRQVLQHVGT